MSLRELAGTIGFVKKRVLITGGTGFLGCHLSRKFLKLGCKVTLLDTASLEAKDLIGKVSVLKVDVRNKNKVETALKNQDFVVHAAAALPIQSSKKIIFATNVTGTRNILEAALKNKIKKVVFISSTAVYGVPKFLPEKEYSPIHPIGDYGVSKVMGEEVCHEYMKKGLAINIIRPKTFLGPERLGVFQLWFEAIYSGRHVFILGNGENKYQLLAVSDVADAIAKALFTKVSNQTFNIGAKEFSTWKKDLGAVISYAKTSAKIFGFPAFPSQIILAFLEKLNLSPIAAWHYKTLPVNSYVSINKAEKVLNWHPKKSNKDLLLENYIWYAKNRNDVLSRKGLTHRVGWNFKLLSLFTKI